MTAPRRITIFTHSYPADTGPAVDRLIDVAVAAGIEVQLPLNEVEKRQFAEREGGVTVTDPGADTDLAVVFGGDGTILTALRSCLTRAPVFAFNYGAIGFLSTVERDELDEGIARVVEGRYEVIEMPALAVDLDGERRIGVNDISLHRRPNSRVAELGYSVTGDQLGRVRCDGLVASTPAGSTGYNLANGGPVLAWGVEGFVVSFIAPHTLTARALVVATDAVLTVQNLSRLHGVDVTTDGRTVGSLEPGGHVDVNFRDEQALLAQAPGTTFYARLRSKFGHLAS